MSSLFAVLVIFLTCQIPQALAAPQVLATPQTKAAPDSQCFDFSRPILQARIAVPEQLTYDKSTQNKSNSHFGKTKDRQDFAWVAAMVDRPILPLLDELLNPLTIRNGKDTEVSIQDDPSPHFFRRFKETVILKPTFFLTLEWKEIWATSLLKGTPTAPESFLVSYEKLEGTSHVKHLCGNILLNKVAPNTTRVFLYQELDATRRDAKDILNDLNGTIKTVSMNPPTPSSSLPQ